MNHPLYITGTGCVTIQPHFGMDLTATPIHTYQEDAVPAPDADYKRYIPAMQLRRMGKGIRMAVFSARSAMEQAGIDQVDAIITGTGQGCQKDSEKFLENILENNGAVLNPTPFIQSTHNMAAGSIALMLGCKGYNMTYVQDMLSFETALIDAALYLAEHPGQVVLLGGVDELSDRTLLFKRLEGSLKNTHIGIPVPGSPEIYPLEEMYSEGAAFFTVTDAPVPGSLGRIVGIKTIPGDADPVQEIRDFINAGNVAPEMIDAVIYGSNGDFAYEPVYREVSHRLFPEVSLLAYRHVLGTYDTVSANALVLGLSLINYKEIPDAFYIRKVDRKNSRVLIYNQYRGQQHSLVLMESCGFV